jgi:SPP1 family predicted phage head-tail adaptor
MRQRVTIQTRIEAEYGDYSLQSSRNTVATVWARVTNVSGTAQVDSRNAGEGVTHQFIIRYRTDVTKQNELLYNGKRYSIATIQVQGDERDRFLAIDANEQDTVGTLDNPSPES